MKPNIKPETLEEARLSLKVVKSVFTSEELSYGKVILFASIVNNQSIKMNIEWQKLLEQYKELGSEIHNRKFENREADFFAQVQKAIETKAYRILS